MALLSAAELKLAVEINGTAEDTNLGTIITRVGRMFARVCGYPPATPGAPPSMESRAYSMDLTGDGGRELDLRVYPVASITSASIDESGDFEGDEDSVTVASEVTIRDGRRARMLSDASHAWSTAPASNRVSFVAGYGGASTVNGGHADSATTITVASTAQFAVNNAGGGRVVCGDEVILFTAKTATTLTGCTRGAEGTTAASILTGAAISQPIPDDLKQLAMMYAKHLWTLLKVQGKESAPAGQSSIQLRDETIPEAIMEQLVRFALPASVIG